MNAARLAALVTLLAPGLAAAVNPAVWEINETLTRDESELFWTSPTAVDLGLDRYTFDYEITRVTATAIFTVDVTDQIGQSFPLTGSGVGDSLPLLLFDNALNDPTTGTTADVRIEVDADGFGQAAFTNVALGSVLVLGSNLPITAVNLQATVTVTGEEFAPGDYNGDGTVDLADYNVWLSNFGAATPHPADGNDDGRIDAADYTLWRDNLSAPAPAAVPEPGTGLLAIMAVTWGGWGQSRRRRPQF